jgi:hypothetical protein
MNGMDMGVATRLDSFASFVALWVPMIAAMMLPGTAPAVLRCAHASGRVRAVRVMVGVLRSVWWIHDDRSPSLMVVRGRIPCIGEVIWIRGWIEIEHASNRVDRTFETRTNDELTA